MIGRRDDHEQQGLLDDLTLTIETAMVAVRTGASMRVTTTGGAWGVWPRLRCSPQDEAARAASLRAGLVAARQGTGPMRGRLGSRTAVVVAVLAAGLFLNPRSAFAQLRHKAGEYCGTIDDCVGALVCIDNTCWDRNEWCRQRDVCSQYGWCTFSPEAADKRPPISGSIEEDDLRVSLGAAECAAVSKADCQRGSGCSEDGRCTARNGECVAGSNKDCQKSRSCRGYGWCSLKRTREGATCTLTRDDDCRRMSACEEDGKCGFRYGECRATKESHCRNSTECKQSGYCYLDQRRGRCRTDRHPWKSYAEDDAWCASLGACAERGDCTKLGDSIHDCKPNWDKDCIQSRVCRDEGKCSYNAQAEACVAGKDADCRKATACKAEGRCSARDGKCVAGIASYCRRSKACRSDGKCTLVGGACAVASDADCRRSPDCRVHGNCFYDPDMGCHYNESVDCKRTEGCRKWGACSVICDGCAVGSVEDCKRSEACRLKGMCRYDEDNVECVK